MLHKQPISKNQLLTILVIVVCVVVAVVHWPVLSAKALSFDDNQYLTDNILVQNPGWASAKRFLTEILRPSTVEGYYPPLAMISLMLDYKFGGRENNLMPFHRTSLILHIANTALIIVLLYRLFGQPIPAALAGLLFGVHPLTVEPVAWISDRKTLLAMFFTLWSLIFYIHLRTPHHARRMTILLYIGSFAAYLFALMSKPTCLPIPVLLLVLDYWPLRRFNRKVIIEKTPFFVLGVAFTVITAVSNNRILGISLSSRLEGSAQLLHTFLTVCYLIIFYLRKIFWPTGLSSVYMLPEPMSLSNWAISASVFGVFTLIAGLLFSLRRTRAFLAGLLFFFLAILPVLGIVPFSDWVVASDKYVYMPIIGLLAVLAWAITSLWKRIAVPRTALIALLLFLSSVQIYCLRQYLSHWQDTVGLFEYMLKLTPDSVQTLNNLAWVMATADDSNVKNPAAAVKFAEKACNLTGYEEPNFLDTLAAAYAATGRFSAAVAAAEKAMELSQLSGKEKLASEIKNRLSLYKAGKAYMGH